MNFLLGSDSSSSVPREVLTVVFRLDLAVMRLLNIEFPAILLAESNCVFLRRELQIHSDIGKWISTESFRLTTRTIYKRKHTFPTTP